MTTPDTASFIHFFLLRLLVVIAMAMAGAAAALRFKTVSHRTLCVLISFAAGALLAVAVLDILPEAIELSGWGGGAVSILSGYGLFFVISRFVAHICPACSATHTEINFKAITLTMVLALSVHSFMDGLAVYSGYLSGSSLGLFVLLAVAYHKFPEGMALALVARGSGMSRMRAFLICAVLEGATTLAGGVAGFAMLLPSEDRWVGYVLGHVGGGFVFLVIHALLSEVVKHHPRSTLLAALTGAASIAALGFFHAH